MTKVLCAPKDMIPESRRSDTTYFSMYSHDGLPDVSTVGTSLIDEVKSVDGGQEAHLSGDVEHF